MSKHINHKTLKMNINAKRQNTFFTTPQKPATKRNKGEPNYETIKAHRPAAQ